ncbi:cell envelope integrity protein TolA [Zhihengliuella halotolerans]|uniref:cell envelope integrity protein TolA n=1 Tax=Zhihengliuella halotolerans TaxID=370736 RepID=UPI000C8055AB|nr:cell envelope integrity protein TolA [Zhihengliuella halotolerans]
MASYIDDILLILLVSGIIAAFGVWPALRGIRRNRANKGKPPRRMWHWLPITMIVAVLLCSGVRLSFLPAAVDRAIGDYDAGEHYDAHKAFDDQSGWLAPVPWRLKYNAGTALLAYGLEGDGYMYGAQDRFAEAYELAVDQPATVRCMIVTNWAIAAETGGDYWTEAAEETAAEREEVIAELDKKTAGEPYDEDVVTDYNGDPIDPGELLDRIDSYYSIAERDFVEAQAVLAFPDCEEAAAEESEEGDGESEQEQQDESESDQEQQDEEAAEQDSASAQQRAEASERNAEKEQSAREAQSDYVEEPEAKGEPQDPEKQRQAELEKRTGQGREDAEVAEYEQVERERGAGEGGSSTDPGADDGDGDGDGEGDGTGGGAQRNW